MLRAIEIYPRMSTVTLQSNDTLVKFCQFADMNISRLELLNTLCVINIRITEYILWLICDVCENWNNRLFSVSSDIGYRVQVKLSLKSFWMFDALTKTETSYFEWYGSYSVKRQNELCNTFETGDVDLRHFQSFLEESLNYYISMQKQWCCV